MPDTAMTNDAARNMWPVNGPDKLEDSALRFLSKNLSIIAEQGKARLPFDRWVEDAEDCAAMSPEKDDFDLGAPAPEFDTRPCVDPEITSCYHLRPGISLPKSICDRFLITLNENSEELKEMTYEKLSIFSNTEVTSLSVADLRPVADHSLEMGLKMISAQPLIELTMPCVWRCLPIIKKLKGLRYLRLEKEPVTNSVDAFIQGQHMNTSENIHSIGSQVVGNPLFSMDEDYYRLTCPNLRWLVLHNLQFRAAPARDLSFNSMVVSSLLSPLTGLHHLSLSMCRLNLEELTCLSNMTSLVSLNLSNIRVYDFPTLVEILQPLHRLRHLDLSQGDEDMNPVMYHCADGVLKSIVEAVPTLASLDISGTNLAGFEVEDAVSHRLGPSQKDKVKTKKCSIPGLENHELEFLGLYGCAHDACRRRHIPAVKVTGDADCDQVVLAVQRYVDNHLLLTRALNDLFSLFRFVSVTNHRLALEGVLAAMKMYPKDCSIQIAGSASLFYIAKGDQKQFITYQHKRELVNLLLAAMSEHCFDQTMMRNASLTLCHLNLPGDVMFCYERLVKQLLDMLKYDYRDDFIHRLGIFLLNCLACQVDGQEKELVGRLGTIETMLQIISRKTRANECDDVLEIAWSTLWNVTDETPSNCQKFLNKGGMGLFVSCLNKFEDKPELLRNMMGLMGNIAEVDSLRNNLMTEEYVEIFSDLLQSESDGIEVSYNACGVLAHLCFDGRKAWTLTRPSRQSVMRRMRVAIGRWPLSSKRNINYRSFEPILRLVNHVETPVVQYWACWALCNLTSVSPDKYCRLLESGNGRKTLERIFEAAGTKQYIKSLLWRTLAKMDHARRIGYDFDNYRDDEDVNLDGQGDYAEGDGDVDDDSDGDYNDAGVSEIMNHEDGDDSEVDGEGKEGEEEEGQGVMDVQMEVVVEDAVMEIQ